MSPLGGACAQEVKGRDASLLSASRQELDLLGDLNDGVVGLQIELVLAGTRRRGMDPRTRSGVLPAASVGSGLREPAPKDCANRRRRSPVGSDGSSIASVHPRSSCRALFRVHAPEYSGVSTGSNVGGPTALKRHDVPPGRTQA